MPNAQSQSSSWLCLKMSHACFLFKREDFYSSFTEHTSAPPGDIVKIRCWKQRDEQSRGHVFKELIVCQIKRVYTDNAIEFDKSYDRHKFRMCGISQKGHLTMLPNGYETWGRSWRMNKNSLKRVDEEGRGKSIWKDMKQRTWKIFRKVESAKHGAERWAVSLS